ncbi:MAG: type II secretion system protein [Chthoniobacteraceae bacterium]
MKSIFHNQKNRPSVFLSGFTLVELVLAQAIFLVVLAVVFQLIIGVTQNAQSQKNKMDSMGDARQALDRISLDWAARVRRQDVTANENSQVSFVKQTGNDELNFLSQVGSYSGARNLAWVSYQVTSGTSPTDLNAYTLQRSAIGYNWTATPQFISSGTSGFTPPSTSGTNTFETMANTVFRCEFCFLVQQSGTSSPVYSADPTITLGSSNLVGVVVTVASLDQQSRQLISSTQLANLAGALPDITTTSTQDPQSAWVPIITNTGATGLAAKAGVPQKVASAVRVYQRILYVGE